MSTEQIQDNSRNVAKLWTRVEVLESKVLGNGSEGHEQRIARMETQWANRESACFGLKAVEKMIKERNTRRTWRVGDLANVIQLVVLLVMVYGIFK